MDFGSGFGNSIAAGASPTTTQSITARLGFYNDATFGTGATQVKYRQWEWQAVQRVLLNKDGSVAKGFAADQYYDWRPVYQPKTPDAQAHPGVQSSQSYSGGVPIVCPAIEVNNSLGAQSGDIVPLTPSGVISMGNNPPDSVNVEYTFQLQTPSNLVVGQLTQELAVTDTYASIRYYRADGSWSDTVQALNLVGCQGASLTNMVAIPNTLPASKRINPFIVVYVQTFLRNTLNAVTFDSTSGTFYQNLIQVSSGGPGITSNDTLPSINPAQITQTVDAGTDEQRDDTTITATTLSPASPNYAKLAVSLSATVSHATGLADPAGDISFIVGGVVVATSGAISGAGLGTATVNADLLYWAAGQSNTGTITAYYNGNSSYGECSHDTTFTLGAVTPTVTLTAYQSTAPSVNITSCTYGDPIVLNAVVTLPAGYNSAAALSGTIEFKTGSTSLGIVALSQVTVWQALLPISTLQHLSGPNALSAIFTPADTTILNSATGTLNLTVNKATLTVTTDNQTSNYGSPLPTLTTTITGWLNGDGTPAISGVFNVTSTGSATTDAGDYPITAAVGTATSTNYTFTFVNTGILTILQGNLFVTATDVSVPKGSAKPALPCTIGGIMNSDNITATGNSNPSMNTVGSYVINAQVNNPKPQNYVLTLVSGVLTVY